MNNQQNNRNCPSNQQNNQNCPSNRQNNRTENKKNQNAQDQNSRNCQNWRYFLRNIMECDGNFRRIFCFAVRFVSISTQSIGKWRKKNLQSPFRSAILLNRTQKGTVVKMDKISRTYHRGRVLCTLFALGDGFAVSIEENDERTERTFFSLDDAKLVFRTACTLELLPSVLCEFCDFLTEEKIISAWISL